MCLAVYLASSQPLPAVAWDEGHPAFYLELAKKDDDVRQQFSKPHVYFVGSHEGCGCGFLKDGEVGDDLAKCHENYLALASVLRDALSRAAELEIFACWEGEQSLPPKAVAHLSPSAMSAPEYEFGQLVRFVVRSPER